MRAAEVLASRILFWGGLLSILLMALGVVGFGVTTDWGAPGGFTGWGAPGGSTDWGAPGAPQAPRERSDGKAAGSLGQSLSRAPESPRVFTSIGEVGRALRRRPVEPLAIVAAGILLLVVTPFVGVVAVFVVFAADGDRRYAGIAAVLIAALLVSLVFVGR